MLYIYLDLFFMLKVQFEGCSLITVNPSVSPPTGEGEQLFAANSLKQQHRCELVALLTQQMVK